ncbi:P-type DNA transfer ATPase VirB11 [Sandarakinorhabdus limnophila]|uniref:P-type DNA transfer ATPase VirB11 n=1 Tax=Sandarakinorhabdus limnophila TaxID=210512 RepID=UPI0003B479DF|nr:P-type DNA transfer ATPase VirB11 [Sandarakinorhabdus limnophila]
MTNVADIGADGVYLRSFLAPLAPWLERDDVTEILINRPDEIWVESNGRRGMEQIAVAGLGEIVLARLVAQVARANNQGVNRAQPLLSGLLPGGARIQIIAPPATRQHLAIAIRKHVQVDIDLADYAAAGAFANVRTRDSGDAARRDAELRQLLDAGNILGFLEHCVATRKNILVAGGTSSGKTTFLNALLKRIPTDERIIVIEDTPEVALGRPNALGLVAVRGETGEAMVTTEDLLQASLRMRPDRLLLGEMRGKEAFSFLRAINTGHPGSISTIHADSPRGAIEQVALLALQARVNLGREEIIAYAHSVIDVVIQVERGASGQRGIAEIALVKDMR